MSQFSEFIQQHEISVQAVADLSKRLEQYSQADRDLKDQRETARRTKKTYEELNIAKPSSSGRGLSVNTVQRAVTGHKLSPRVRGKLLRAVNAYLVSNKKDAVDVIGLFGNNAKPKEEEPTEEAAE